MQFNHTSAALSAEFDDINLVSASGLVPVMRLAERAGLTHLADTHLTVPSDKGANAGAKVASLIAGMVAGADSIDDMRLLRHGGMTRLFDRVYAPSTLWSFLRAFEFGHVRQLDAVASRFLTSLTRETPGLLPAARDEFTFVDVDDTIIEVEGYLKQGASFGYSGVRGLNAVLAVASTKDSAPVVLTQRLRKGATSSARGAKRVVGDALAQLGRMSGAPDRRVLVRADAAYYSHTVARAALAGGADVSVTVRMNPSIKRAIETISDHAWQPIMYPGATRDEVTGRLISRAEVAEVPYTAFASRKPSGHVTGRLIVRRVPELGPKAHRDQPTLFDTWRFHAFFTTVDHDGLDTVAADQTHRHHAVIEQVNADLKASALAHLPSGKYAANGAWLVLAVIALNLTRAAAVIADQTGKLRNAVTQTIRRTLINVPARVASSARKLRLHLPERWPWAREWAALLTHSTAPPSTVVS